MLRPQMIGLALTFAGSGCSMLSPSGMEVTPAGQIPGQDARGQNLDLLFSCRFDPDAKQMSQADFRPGQEVQVIMIDRHVTNTWGSEDISLTMTLYAGTVASVDGETLVLKDVIRTVEGRTESGLPMLQSAPYLSRMFRNSGVGRETVRMSDDVTISRKDIGGAFELSRSGVEKLLRLRNCEEADAVLETISVFPAPERGSKRVTTL